MQAAPAAAPRRRRNANRNRNRNSEMNMLTGGTGDVKPEMLTYSAVMSAADTTTTTTTALPILRNFSSGNGSRAQIVEILKAFIFLPAPVEVDSDITVLIGTKNLGTTNGNFGDPSIFAAAGNQMLLTTSGQVVYDRLRVIDLTDGAGNGILVATDNIFTQISSSTTSSVNTTRVKLLYRVYAASVTEYVGIVQGQQ
jgi:hypothetical protein